VKELMEKHVGDFVHRPSGLSRTGWLACLARSVSAILFPPRCLLCSSPLDETGGRFCTGCNNRVVKDCTESACPTCASTVAPHSIIDGRCPRCRGRRLPVTRVVRVGAYGPGLGTLIAKYKYAGGDQSIGNVLGQWLADAVEHAPLVAQPEAIVPVPTTRWRRIRRSIHVPTEVAVIVSRRLGVPVMPVLRRIRGGPRQIGLTYPQRIENVRGAFAMSRGFVTLRGARLLLVDDVATSGATIMECARVLRRGGADTVSIAIIARARRSTEARPAL